MSFIRRLLRISDPAAEDGDVDAAVLRSAGVSLFHVKARARGAHPDGLC
jgi:hypothetical protein